MLNELSNILFKLNILFYHAFSLNKLFCLSALALIGRNVEL